MQAVLLRFLETGELQRVGADRVHARVNVRVVAATNRDLMAEIRAGRFREDLFYRLNVLHIHVMPLRERREDVPELLQHFLREFTRHATGTREFADDVLARLSAHDWPGNVRQLKNVVERVVVKSTDPVIQLRDLPRDLELRRQVQPAGTIPQEAEPAVVPALLSRMLEGRESFWSVVHTPFMDRDLTRANLTEVVSRGLERSGGNYRSLVTLFNMPQSDYKRFLTFLTSHRCHVRFQAFRSLPDRGAIAINRKAS